MTSDFKKTMLYSSFNARALEPVEVAETFIPPPEFFRLANRSHTFIVGPRGSGKTTLLKMLQQPAVEAWLHPSAQELRDNISFTGIFVPTDITLTSQLHAATSHFEEGRTIVRAAYAIHILRAFISALEYRVGRINTVSRHEINRIDFSDEQEFEFVSELAYSLGRKPRTPSFGSLRTNLTAWLSDVYAVSQLVIDRRPDEQTQLLQDSGLLALDLTRTTSLAIDVLEGVSRENSGRWALLCDELELAPPFIVQDLIRRVRSTDDRFLFKLSLSPFVAGENDFGGVISTVGSEAPDDTETFPAQENQDFDTIRLWFPNKQEGQAFARELAQSIVHNKGLQSETIDEILGRSVFDAPPNSDKNAYSPGSPRNERMKRLAKLDPTFSKYLDEKAIDLDRDIRDDDMRAKTLRKINSIVVVREAFRKGESARSRKNPGIYGGASAFFAICESNPRFLIGMLNQLLGDKSLSRNPVRIDASQQAAVYASATARFRAYLRTIPSPSIDGIRARGLLSIIQKIGHHFHEECVAGDFDDDPDCSFTVDSNADSTLQEALQIALNSGAIIWVPHKQDESLLTSVRGKRFRLSYLLAPHYQLPLHLGRSASLGRILGLTRSSRRPDPSLFDQFTPGDGE